jgi:bifunctional polynucleotide phosphatase/kinase
LHQQLQVCPCSRSLALTNGDADKAVASFFKPTSQKEPQKLIWRIIKSTLIVGRYGNPFAPSPTRTLPVKIAAFDLDDTLIIPSGPNRWVRSASSWKWFHASVPAKLKQLHNDGYVVVVLSNQANVIVKKANELHDPASLRNLKACLNAAFNSLDVPLSFYAATGEDHFRKPRTGMWDELLGDYDLRDDGAVDLANSFYIGDAAGREKTDKRRKDHSTCDR